MKKIYIWGYVSLLAAYLVLSIVLPPDPASLERYGITAIQAKLLSLSITLPITLIYAVALYGFRWLKSFALTVADTKEGRAYNQIADGLTIFTFSLPLMSIFSSLTNYLVVRNPEWLGELVVARNYFRVIITVVAFTLIARGAEKLVTSVKVKPTFERPHLSLLGTILLTTVYVWLIVTRNHAPQLAVPSYYLPDPVVLFTQAIPLLFVWCRGLRAMYHLYVYREKLGGRVYRRAWDLLARGIALTIVVAIMMQFIVTASDRLIAINLTPILLLVYLLVVGYAVSFSFIAVGAKKLKMIEEV